MHQGPWSTDLEPWIVDSISRFKLRGSRLLDAEPGVTWVVCWIWIDLGRGGVGVYWRCLRLGPWAGDGWLEAEKSNFDWTSHFPERLAGPSVGLFSLGPQTLNTLD